MEIRRGSRRRVKHFLRDSTYQLIGTRDIVFPHYEVLITWGLFVLRGEDIIFILFYRLDIVELQI